MAGGEGEVDAIPRGGGAKRQRTPAAEAEAPKRVTGKSIRRHRQ